MRARGRPQRLSVGWGAGQRRPAAQAVVGSPAPPRPAPPDTNPNPAAAEPTAQARRLRVVSCGTSLRCQKWSRRGPLRQALLSALGTSSTGTSPGRTQGRASFPGTQNTRPARRPPFPPPSPASAGRTGVTIPARMCARMPWFL